MCVCMCVCVCVCVCVCLCSEVWVSGCSFVSAWYVRICVCVVHLRMCKYVRTYVGVGAYVRTYVRIYVRM